jgi:hypothetical protein
MDMENGKGGKEMEKEQDKMEGKAASDAGSSADMFSIVLTPAQWRKLMILAFGSLVNNITYGLLAPFFPSVARERGVSEWHVGLIFGGDRRDETRIRIHHTPLVLVLMRCVPAVLSHVARRCHSPPRYLARFHVDVKCARPELTNKNKQHVMK